MSEEEVAAFLPQIMRILYRDYYKSFKDVSYSLKELMLMHRKIFRISSHIHDLFCRGHKDYIEAFRNVQDYNLSKLMQRKTSIPSTSDVYNEGRCYWNIIYAIQMDIENFNYMSIVFAEWRAGKLTEEERKRRHHSKGT